MKITYSGNVKLELARNINTGFESITKETRNSYNALKLFYKPPMKCFHLSLSSTPVISFVYAAANAPENIDTPVTNKIDATEAP